MARFRGVLTIDAAGCKGCSLCVEACALHLLALDDEINAMGYHPAAMREPARCTACAQCAMMCPDVCIRVDKVETE